MIYTVIADSEGVDGLIESIFNDELELAAVAHGDFEVNAKVGNRKTNVEVVVT